MAKTEVIYIVWTHDVEDDYEFQPQAFRTFEEAEAQIDDILDTLDHHYGNMIKKWDFITKESVKRTRYVGQSARYDKPNGAAVFIYVEETLLF